MVAATVTDPWRAEIRVTLPFPAVSAVHNTVA